MQGAQQQVGDERDGDLDAHGVFRAAEELGDLQCLLHHPEEQFDLRATLVEVGDLSGARVEVVGENAQRFSGVRLLTRTTRRVSPTEAGERLLRAVAPRFEELDAEIAVVTALRDTPAGTIRLTATENAPASVLLPALERFLPKYPDVEVEIVVDVGLTDIVAERSDADVRFGELVADGMISVRIAPDARMAVVGAPSYFADRKTPKAPQDLTGHDCINLRLPRGGLYAWEFEKAWRELNVHVDGQLVFGSSGLILAAARAGLGLAYLTEEQVRGDLKSGRLVRVLSDWCAPFSGYHLYYPNRRTQTYACGVSIIALL